MWCPGAPGTSSLLLLYLEIPPSICHYPLMLIFRWALIHVVFLFLICKTGGKEAGQQLQAQAEEMEEATRVPIWEQKCPVQHCQRDVADSTGQHRIDQW